MQERLGNELNPLEHGWEQADDHRIGLIPVQGFNEMCPKLILKSIACSCSKKDCTACGCSKHGLKCSELCGCGELCENRIVLEDIGDTLSDHEDEDSEEDLDRIV